MIVLQESFIGLVCDCVCVVIVKFCCIAQCDLVQLMFTLSSQHVLSLVYFRLQNHEEDTRYTASTYLISFRIKHKVFSTTTQIHYVLCLDGLFSNEWAAVLQYRGGPHVAYIDFYSSAQLFTGYNSLPNRYIFILDLRLFLRLKIAIETELFMCI